MITIATLFGGPSVEHEVSVITANQAIQILLANPKYTVIPIYITKEGKWLTGDALLDLKNYKNLKTLVSKCHEVDLSFSKNSFIYKEKGWFKKPVELTIDIAFPLFHGTYGEDGCVQGVLELMDIPYVGSNVLASATTMDKVITKMVLAKQGIPVLPFEWFYSEDWLENKESILNNLTNSFSFPMIIKPADLGSSVGISKVNGEQELEDGIQEAVAYSKRILVEPAVVALKEVNCSVLGNNVEMETSICEEPVGSDQILSFSDKYKSSGKQKGMSSLKRKIPAEITIDQEERVKSLAKATFAAFQSSGLVRIDFIIDESNENIYVNEVNTIPGSLAFYLWEKSDYPFSKLIDKLIKLGIKQFTDKKRLTRSFDGNLLADHGNGLKSGSKLKVG